MSRGRRDGPGGPEAERIIIRPVRGRWEWRILDDNYPCEPDLFDLETGSPDVGAFIGKGRWSMGTTRSRRGARRAARRALRTIETRRRERGWEPLPGVEWIDEIYVPFASREDAEEVLAAAGLKLGAGHRGVNHLRIALGLPFGIAWGKEQTDNEGG